MRNFFEYAGKRSQDFGIYISGSGTFNAPERDVQYVSVPGRNGELLIDNGRFKNISVTYPAYIHRDFKILSDAAKSWLLSQKGYARLADTYHPDIFRMGVFSGPLDFDMRFLNNGGECELLFNCKPQRYLRIGEAPVIVTGAMTMYNPTSFTSLPSIRVYGSAGRIMIGNQIMDLAAIDGYVDIDSETQNAYKEMANCNSKISGSFPVLPTGQTGVRFSGSIEKLEIRPRWWTI